LPRVSSRFETAITQSPDDVTRTIPRWYPSHLVAPIFQELYSPIVVTPLEGDLVWYELIMQSSSQQRLMRTQTPIQDVNSILNGGGDDARSARCA